MLKAGINKFISSSTAATYGEPIEKFIKEDHPKKPINPYGESKLAFERILNDVAKAHGLGCVILKYFNVAGAHESGEIGEMHDPETHILPLALEAAINDKEFTVFGNDYDTPDGTCVRDYIHPCDLIEAHILALRSLEEKGMPKVYNMGNGKGFSVKEIIAAVNKVTGKELKYNVGKRRTGDPAVLVASSAKISNELGWQAEYNSIERIIETAYRWHLNLHDNKP
jgi:UDP-glucose 4-epimerase